MFPELYKRHLEPEYDATIDILTDVSFEARLCSKLCIVALIHAADNLKVSIKVEQ